MDTLLLKRCNSKNNDDIANALSGIVANDLKYHSIYSVERIRQQHFTHSILKFCKDSSPMLHSSIKMSSSKCRLHCSNIFEIVNAANILSILLLTVN